MATKSKDQPSEYQKLPNLQQPQETQQMQKSQQAQQTQQPAATEVIAMPPQVQALPLGDQEAEINRLTSVAAQWSTREPCRANNTNSYNDRHWSTHHQSTLNMSLITQNYNRQHVYAGGQMDRDTALIEDQTSTTGR